MFCGGFEMPNVNCMQHALFFYTQSGPYIPNKIYDIPDYLYIDQNNIFYNVSTMKNQIYGPFS